MLVISLVLGIIPLLGIAWLIASGSAETVDGLFLALILLTLSGILLLNAAWEARARGYLKFIARKKTEVPARSTAPTSQAQKATAGAESANITDAAAKTTGETPIQKTT